MPPKATKQISKASLTSLFAGLLGGLAVGGAGEGIAGLWEDDRSHNCEQLVLNTPRLSEKAHALFEAQGFCYLEAPYAGLKEPEEYYFFMKFIQLAYGLLLPMLTGF